MLIDECSEFISQTFSKHAIIKSNGDIIKTTIEEATINKIFPVLKKLLDNNIEINDLIVRTPIVFFRVTNEVIIVLLTAVKENIIQSMFSVFIQKFQEALLLEYPDIINRDFSLGNIIKFSIFSVARQNGPEAFSWWENVDPDIIFKYSTSSLLLLMNELEGASRRTLNFHPFISENYFGIIFLFQIPAKGARGEAFDSTILVMSDYKYRNVFYQLHDELEQVFNEIANDIIITFQDQFKDDVQGPITDEMRDNFNLVLKKMHNKLEKYSINLDNKK